MFERLIVNELRVWKRSRLRKPLILRGARQVGKTTVVNQFSAEYSQYIYLNLEQELDRNVFTRRKTIEEIIQVIFLRYNKRMEKLNDTLLFIDEIQEAPEAVAMLRYFYETYPDLHVIAAGSLLETLFGKGINFPVGRVEYRVLRPVSFPEFLGAMKEEQAIELYSKVPLPSYAYDKLLNLFHIYTLIGGMPEVVHIYSQTRDLTILTTIYETLIASYFDDTEKYAKNQNQVQLLRHAIRAVFYEAGTRVKFQGFGASSYSSREMGEILRILEKTMLIHLTYPTTQTSAPWLPDIKRSPRLQVLDTGMLNFFSGLQTELIGTTDLNSHFKGRIAEHIVGQEILGSNYTVLNSLKFWVREKKQSDAEVDFLFSYKGRMIPVEVKSGKSGKLRSLHQYIDASGSNIAVRLYAGEIRLEEHTTISGNSYKLLNMPYFLSAKLIDYLQAYC